MSIIVKVIDREVKLKKLALREYAEVFEGLQEIPKRLASIGGAEQATVLAALPAMIGKSLPELAHILSVASHKQITKDEIINKFGLDDVAELLTGVLEVNNYDKTVEAVKKLFARQSQTSKTNQSGTGLTEQLTSSPASTAGQKITSTSESTPTNSSDTRSKSSSGTEPISPISSP